MAKSIRGFTIVELLIVIAVIGILAAIVIVAYNGTQYQARNAARAVQLVAWRDIFETYRARTGDFPAMANAGYCLGTGFPRGVNNEPRCRDYLYNNSAYSYRESDSTALMTALKTVTNLPGGPYIPINETVGPYVDYYNDSLEIIGAFNGGASDCPPKTTYEWHDGDGLLLCAIILDRD